MTEIIDGLIVLLVMAGALLTLISAIGALRLPDVYMRSHAIGKSTTLGMIFILTGTLFYFWLKHHHFNSRLSLLNKKGVPLLMLGHLFMISNRDASPGSAGESVQDDLIFPQAMRSSASPAGWVMPSSFLA